VQYGTTEGVNELRHELIKYMGNLGVKVDSIDEIVITTGSQQGLQLCGRALIDPGDLIIVADPTYLAALSVWRWQRASLRDVDVDHNGMKINELERKLEQQPLPKFIYDVPTFSNPSGITMNVERRKQFIKLAHEHETIIVEDDPYSALRYDGESVPPVKAFDNGSDSHVVYLGTFSKILAPGFRVGWMVGPPDLMKEMAKAKQSIDLCTSPFNQYIAALYLAENYFSEHIEKVKKIYKERRDVMLKEMKDHFPTGIKWTHPEGGMFVWATCPECVNTKELAKVAIKEKKVAYVSGASFRVHGQTNNMRLNFSSSSPEQIEIGIEKLGELLTPEVEKDEKHHK
jgi:2-aminoadipate transaminase